MTTTSYIGYGTTYISGVEGIGDSDESGLRVITEEELSGVSGAVAPLVVAAYAAGAFVVAAAAGYWANRN